MVNVPIISPWAYNQYGLVYGKPRYYQADKRIATECSTVTVTRGTWGP